MRKTATAKPSVTVVELALLCGHSLEQIEDDIRAQCSVEDDGVNDPENLRRPS
jgi:hypothetical protein